MREELNREVKPGRLLWVIENFFLKRDKNYHELGFVYDLVVQDSDTGWKHTTTDGGVAIRFEWFALNHLDSINLRPQFLKESLRHPPRTTEHLVIREQVGT